MRDDRLRWSLGLALCAAWLSTGPAQADDSKRVLIPIDDSEAEPPTWKFVGGEEFPGAKGSLVRDPSRSHAGKASIKLEADFRGGGAYVGTWKELKALKLPEIEEFRFRYQARGLNRLGVRIVDETGQCHQSSVDLPPSKGDGWSEVVLNLSKLVGGEHWGGSNDGLWHGSPTGLGLNIGKNAVLASSQGQATLWIDDLIAVTPAAGLPTLRACSITPSSCRPGYGTRIRYQWDAEPLGANANIFVHFVNAQGQMVFQADHEPPVPTARWSGRVEYSKTTVVPDDLAPGRYDVVIGIWNPRTPAMGGGRKPFQVGSGLTKLPDEACRVGTLEVATNAPLPVLPAPSLDLSAFRLTFDEDFSGPLSISSWGPGTRWIAHTPYGGDFGDAGFANPEEDSPFTVKDGILEIEARKVGEKWRSGLICSVDPRGNGFSQKFGYFEMKAKLPQGLGTWPAFWLMGVPQLVEPKDKKTIPQIEIDVVEQYGVGPQALHTTLHLWGPGEYHWAEGDTSIVSGMTDGFHTYGVLVEDDFTTFYFDGIELRKDKTPKDAKVPLYLMVDLALGGGWPIDQTPNPSRMLVDHVRVLRQEVNHWRISGTFSIA